MSFPKIVCDGPNTFSIGSKIDSHILYLLVQTFCAGTNIFGAALNAIQFLVWQKKVWTVPKHFGTCKRTRHICCTLMPQC